MKQDADFEWFYPRGAVASISARESMSQDAYLNASVSEDTISARLSMSRDRQPLTQTPTSDGIGRLIAITAVTLFVMLAIIALGACA